MHWNVRKISQALALGVAIGSGSVTSAHADATVSVTAEFTLLTMGGFYSGPNTAVNGLSVNGNAIDVCGNDTTCSNAVNNPGSITAGLSGSAVTFGYVWNGARMNEFSFVGSSTTGTATDNGTQFKLGTLTFTNGMFYPLAYFDFTLTTRSTDAKYDDHKFSGRINLSTNNTGADNNSTDQGKMAEADYFTVSDLGGNLLPSLGSVRVYDYSVCPSSVAGPACNTGSVDLIGYIGSLHLDSFANPTGGAFLNSSTGSVLNPGNSVPEPTSGALSLTGLIGCLAVIERRRARRHAVA
jgi:hypothetical protein